MTIWFGDLLLVAVVGWFFGAALRSLFASSLRPPTQRESRDRANPRPSRSRHHIDWQLVGEGLREGFEAQGSLRRWK